MMVIDWSVCLCVQGGGCGGYEMTEGGNREVMKEMWTEARLNF
jgi:hypothetical protein